MFFLFFFKQHFEPCVYSLLLNLRLCRPSHAEAFIAMRRVGEEKKELRVFFPVFPVLLQNKIRTAHEGRDINNVTAEEKVLSAALTRQKRGKKCFTE